MRRPRRREECHHLGVGWYCFVGSTNDRNRRPPVRYSFGLIQRYGDFVVNLPRADQADILEYCGTVSGRSEDKFAKAGITAVKGDYVRSPLAAEFPVNIECKVRDRLSLGSHDLFLGEVVSVHADPDVLTNGEVDAVKARPLAYFKGRYYRLGERIPVGEQ